MAIDKYKHDYEIVVTLDEEGHEKRVMVYRGDYFEVDLDQEGIIRFRKYSFLLLAAILVLQIGAGFVDNLGMYQFYIALPYALAFFPLLYLAAGILHLPKEKRKYRRDEIGLSFDRVKNTSFILMIFLTIGLLGEIIFIVFGSLAGQGELEYRYLLLEVLATTAGYFLIILQRKNIVKACPK